MYSFPDLEPVCCCMPGSNCCFLTCVQFLQEAGKVFRYSNLLKHFQQFVMMHRVKALFCVVNEAEVDVSLELSAFLYPVDVGSLISGSSAFLKSSLFLWNLA